MISSARAAEAELRIPSHLEFTSQWFPIDAAAATHCDVVRGAQLASRLSGSQSRFLANLRVLDLIRENVGFDHSQIERFTTATITVGTAGTVIFFTLNDVVLPEKHFATGQFPLTPQIHRFHNKQIYQLPSENRPLGLYSAEGKHFILGDWATFKTTLLGNDGELNEIAKILSAHAAPITICSNPRRAGNRIAKDAPFGTVIAVDFRADTLAFLLQEEHATPAAAARRLARFENEMPQAFETAYGLRTKNGVRYLSESDGRHVTFAMECSVRGSKRLLEHLLLETRPSDPRAFANATAARSIELFEAAKAAGAAAKSIASSPDAIVAALCVGLETKTGRRFQLPFLTGVEQQSVAGRLVLEAGILRLAPEAQIVAAAGPITDDSKIRRHAQLIATLTMSAAAAKSPDLKKLSTAEAIVETLCTSGLRGGPGYPNEKFKGPELNPAERERVVELLVPNNGYLRYKAD